MEKLTEHVSHRSLGESGVMLMTEAGQIACWQLTAPFTFNSGKL